MILWFTFDLTFLIYHEIKIENVVKTNYELWNMESFNAHSTMFVTIILVVKYNMINRITKYCFGHITILQKNSWAFIDTNYFLVLRNNWCVQNNTIHWIYYFIHGFIHVWINSLLMSKHNRSSQNTIFTSIFHDFHQSVDGPINVMIWIRWK